VNFFTVLKEVKLPYALCTTRQTIKSSKCLRINGADCILAEHLAEMTCLYCVWY